ncbi:MAG: radical SAM protein [Puniceicoccales bacterium]|nr:radical SAM protein [Puniceicoccales bacterium]
MKPPRASFVPARKNALARTAGDACPEWQMTIRLAAPPILNSIVDGEGVRAVVWTQGCLLRCPGCHNPHTHALDGGFETDTERVKFDLRRAKGVRGLTLSGGEPFLQVAACADIARFVRALGWDVWCYTGLLHEQLRADPQSRPLLELIDVLVDGPFILAERDPLLPFRGSRNQRVIRLRETPPVAP